MNTTVCVAPSCPVPRAWLAVVLALSACAREHGTQSDMTGQAGRTRSGAAGTKARPAANVGATAVAKLVPVSPSDGSAAGAPATAVRPVMGTATFVQRDASVNLTLSFVGCGGGHYTAFILEGRDCEQATLQGPHWDPPRGEGIAEFGCIASGDKGLLQYARAANEAKPWTIGSSASSDIVGHAFALFASNMPEQPVACGTIELGETPPVPDAGAGAKLPPVAIRAVLGGLCLEKVVARNNDQSCPDPMAYDECVRANCSFNQCLAPCADQIACLKALPQDGSADLCSSCNSESNMTCSDCLGNLRSCAVGFCLDQLSCAAPPTPGGPCSKLEACCAMQGDRAQSCLDSVHLLERISGDPSCNGVMHDWDTTAHLLVPCNFGP